MAAALLRCSCRDTGPGCADWCHCKTQCGLRFCLIAARVGETIPQLQTLEPCTEKPRTYAVDVLAGVTQLFRPGVAATPPHLGGKRSSLEGFALQTSQLRNS